MKKLIEDLNIFRKDCMVIQYFSDEIQTSISFIKDDIQNSTNSNISYEKEKEILFWLNRGGQKYC